MVSVQFFKFLVNLIYFFIYYIYLAVTKALKTHNVSAMGH